MPGSRKKPILRLKDDACVREINPTEEILNEDLLGQAVEECLKDEDFEELIEVIEIYLKASKKHLKKMVHHEFI
jgi:hypothetical protein